jgi:hypothetical protein
MAEDWRVKVEFQEEHQGHRLTGFLREHDLEHDLAERLRGRVVVSQDGPLLFLYAETQDQAEAAQSVVNSFHAEHSGEAEATVSLARWHEVEERWEDPNVPLPESAAELAAERAKLTNEERADAKADRMDEWEVQVVLPDHHTTPELAKKLEDEGIKLARRWRFLVIPVASEDDGNALADRLRSECPPEARIAVEGTYGRVVADNPRLSAFSLFGGLGG